MQLWSCSKSISRKDLKKMKSEGGKKIPISTRQWKGVKNMHGNKYIFLQTEHFSWDSPTF